MGKTFKKRVQRKSTFLEARAFLELGLSVTQSVTQSRFSSSTFQINTIPIIVVWPGSIVIRKVRKVTRIVMIVTRMVGTVTNIVIIIVRIVIKIVRTDTRMVSIVTMRVRIVAIIVRVFTIRVRIVNRIVKIVTRMVRKVYDGPNRQNIYQYDQDSQLVKVAKRIRIVRIFHRICLRMVIVSGIMMARIRYLFRHLKS